MRVLVTGAAGAIGKPVCEFLAQRGHSVRRFDRLAGEGGDEIVGDIAEPKTVLAACHEVEAVVHLAALPDDAPFAELVPPNVLGLFNVLDAARRQNVKRVVLASSVQVSWSQEPGERRTASHTGPRNHYALTKLWAEQMGEMYTRISSLTVVAARIGWMVRNEREAREIQAHGFTRNYLSRRDVANFMACAIEAPNVSFALLYAVGPGGREAFDLDTARRAIGYEPQDEFPAGLPFELAR